MRRNVIYVVESGGVCGGVRVILEHLNRLRARGWHVEVYSLDSNRPAWFPLNPAIPWFKFGNYEDLVRHLVNRRAAKVATWWKTATPVAEASASGEGFYFVQDVETFYYSAPMQKQIVANTYGLPLVQFSDSPYASERLPNCAFVGLGIDLDLYKPLDTNRQLNAILCLARPQYLKGWSTLCEAYRLLFHTKQFSLHSFGAMGAHPPYSSALPPNIPDEELVRFYNRMGLFLATSIHEGFSLTPLEAMACGAVVVTTEADGNMIYSHHGENCLVVPPENAQAAVDACLQLLEDQDLMTKLQQGGFETAKEWPWEPVIDKLEELYG